MYWNYRLVDRDGYIAIYEVHYEDNKPILITQDPVGFGGDSIEDVKWSWRMAKEAFRKPVLKYEDF